MNGKRIAALFIFFALIIGIVGIVVRSKDTAKAGGLQVVAAENFWGNIASQLGSPYVHVKSIITDPNADPHLYESNAQDAAAVSSANVVIVNGVGYDDFMNRLLGASQSNNRQVITAQQIFGAAEGGNPHLWYNIPEMPKIASRITDAYIANDPAHKSQYEHNLTAFDASLQPLLKTIASIKQQYGGTPVAYTEPVPGYTLSAAGLDVLTPEGFAKSIEDGDDPSPSDTSALQALITNKSIKVLLYNVQTISPVTENIKSLAKQVGIPVIGVSETLPAKEQSYQAWQLGQLNELAHALSETK